VLKVKDSQNQSFLAVSDNRGKTMEQFGPLVLPVPMRTLKPTPTWFISFPALESY